MDIPEYSSAPMGLIDLVRVPPATWQERVQWWLDDHGPLVRMVLIAAGAGYLLR